GDPRREVASKCHGHLTAEALSAVRSSNGKWTLPPNVGLAASGKWDPKGALQINGQVYRLFETSHGKKPKCVICERGDMSWPWRRQCGAKYKPSVWRCLVVRFRAMIKA